MGQVAKDTHQIGGVGVARVIERSLHRPLRRTFFFRTGMRRCSMSTGIG